jgi:hypothetical protein
MKRISAVLAVAAFAGVSLAADAPYVPSDAERARWTMQDIRSWKIALEAYKVDYNKFPEATTLEGAAAAIQGVYINTVPMHDAWGRPFAFERTAEGFRVVSAGADGKFDRESWSQTGKQPSLDADAVVTEQGKFWARWW